ncbi:MAG: aminoacyl-tRNA hydrolase [bacterium]|nr:aminoacyl-tRNA hydrolase [bacterium]
MKLIIGLGNPGEEYEKTRHNVGFMAIDKIGTDLEFSKWKKEKKLEAEVSRGHIASCCEDVILAKPQTFMNNSGRAVKLLTTHYRLHTTDLLIMHDDLDLELGTIKLSYGSGSAGQNGVQSIIDTLGTKDFWRLRIGIGPNHRTLSSGKGTGQERGDAAKFVLKNFSRAEQLILKKTLALATEAVQMMFTLGPQRAQTEVNKL